MKRVEHFEMNLKLSTGFLASIMFQIILILISLESLTMTDPITTPNIFLAIIIVYMCLIAVRELLQIQLLKKIADK